jgi:ABC-type transporter Mla subunit MlaD
VREYAAEAGGHVETLMDDRVRRLLEKASDAYVRVSPEELRAIAETRTARLGAFARYASSLLLLLAVLGTFAGVKTALPGLIDAVSKTGAGRIGTGDITAPLRAVADAFGGNALALVGAIAVGLMAQGVSTGRRNLLERLELVSTEFLYGTLQGGSVDPLVEAVHELNATAESVRQTGTAIAGVEDAIVGLGATFDGAFARLNEQLVEVAERQDEALHERTSADVRELQRRVTALAGVVEQNTRTYQGIVDTVDERARESRAAIDLVRQSAGSLQEALQSVAAFQASAHRTSEEVQQTLKGLQAGVRETLEGLTGGVRETLGALLQGSEAAAGRMEAVAAAVAQAQPAIDGVEGLLRSVSEHVATIDQRASTAWSSASNDVNARIAELLREVRSSNGRASAEVVHAPAAAAPAPLARDPEVLALLRRLAEAAEAQRTPSRTTAFAYGVGTVAALALAYGAFLATGALTARMGW